MDKNLHSILRVFVSWVVVLIAIRFLGFLGFGVVLFSYFLFGVLLPWVMRTFQSWPSFFKKITWHLPEKAAGFMQRHTIAARVLGGIASSSRFLLDELWRMLIGTIALVVLGVQWFLIWFPKQKLAVKVITVLGIVVFIAWSFYAIFFSLFSESFEPLVGSDQPPCVLGIQRVKMTAEEKEQREDLFIETRTFWVLQDTEAVPGFERVAKYRNIFERAAKKHDVDADDLEGICQIESQGRTHVKSPTGPTGLMQITKQTGINLGLVINEYRDDRLNPELAIFAAAKLLRELLNFFGRRDFAINAYHSSQQRVANLVKVYLSPKDVTNGGKRDIEKYGLTYGDVYFRNTPYENPATFAEIIRLKKEVDNGPNYFYKVECAKRLFVLWRNDRKKFNAVADKQKFEGRRAANRMWTFYGENDEAFVSLGDLRSSLRHGKIVPIPNDKKFGFVIRTEGKDVVGQLDLANQEYYMASKPETAGCLLYIASKLQELRAGRRQVSLEVTSITRTVDYQKKLSRFNPVATKKMSFHVLGLAFDITKANLSDQDLRDLDFILEELDSTGFISWVPENAARHVVVAPNPKGIQFFTGVYKNNSGFRSNLLATALPFLW